MARIVPSLQLARTEDYCYTEDYSYTSHLHFPKVDREFFCIQHPSRGIILCRLASFFARLARWELQIK